MNTKTTALVGITLIVSHAAFFALGAISNRRATLNAFATQERTANGAVDLGLYLDYRDIALAITGKQYDRALCAAQLGASGRLDDVKACLAIRDCRIVLEQRVRQSAPEITDGAPLPFRYIAARDGIRSCEKTSGPSPNGR